MEAPLTRLPRYARGLKLVRIGVFIMLAQLGLSVIMTIKGLTADTPEEVFDTIKWVQYFLLANIGAAVVMLIGSCLTISEFGRTRLPIVRAVIAAAGFAIAAAALWWSYHLLSSFIDVALDPDSTAEDVSAAAEGLSSLKLASVVKDLAYVIGLLAVLRTVKQFAVANEQLAMSYAASHLTGLIAVMLVGDLFYQVTYGLGGGSVFPLIGLLASLLVGGYWIYCHVLLTRFLENAAYFVNEPHTLPAATVVSVTTVGEKPRASARTIPAERTAPSTPSAPVIVVAPELRPAPAPRAESVAEDESAQKPKFLT